MNTAKTTSKLTLEDIGSFLSKLAEKSESVYWLSSPDFKKIQYISPAFEKIWGRSPEILYVEPELWITYLHPEDAKSRHPIHEMAQRIVELGAAARFEESYRVIRPDGEIRWILDRGFPVYDEKGTCHGVTGVAVDITREKQIEEALRNANLAKTQFLATISHELRTPLNGIIGIAQLLNKQKLPSQAHEYISDINKAGTHLLSLINDMLDFSKLEAGETELSPIHVDLLKLMKETVNLLSYQANAKGLELTLDYESDTPNQVFIDPRAIQQIIINLVGNAIKFTETGKVFLQVSCIRKTPREAKFQFTVEDSGIGVPQDKIDLIFERFKQIDSTLTRRFGGTGLGLAITKHLVEKMGGKIRVQSQLGKGSTFYVDINLQLVPQTDGIFSQNESEVNPEELFFGRNPGAKILLVEDNLLNCKIMTVMLEDLGNTVDIAKSGAEAFVLLRKPYDLIFMDIGLPDITGIDITKKIRQTQNPNQQTPIIALTAHVFEEDKISCLAAGMNDVLTKPVLHEQLVLVLKSWIAKCPQ
jgi:PAS domain S-box-containing protein